MKKKLNTTYGTSHFVSHRLAVKYYLPQYENDPVAALDAVSIKLKEKSISIGAPELKKGQKLIINQSEGRYFIEE